MEREDLNRQYELAYEGQFAGFNEVCNLLTNEYKKLSEGVETFGQALECGAIEKWRLVSFVVESLVYAKEIDLFFAAAAAKGSPLKDNRDAPRQIVECLKEWRAKGLIDGKDSALEAFNTLAEYAPKQM